MSIRLRYGVTVSVSSSPADSKDLGNVCLNVSSDEPNEGGVWKTRVLAGATVTLPLDSIAAAVFLMLRIVPSDPTLTLTSVGVALNGGTPLDVAPVSGAAESTFLMSAKSLTSLQIINTDPAAVDVDIVIATAGD